MAVNPLVRINGSVLSILMYDHANSHGDQEGFLLGRVNFYRKSEISDQSMCNTKEEIHIDIYSSVPCDDIQSFYKPNGEVIESNVELFLSNRCKKKDVIGWYRYRRHSSVSVSAREFIVHKNLRVIFPSNRYFIYGVFTYSVAPNNATHNLDYGFFRQDGENSFSPLLLNIVNLGDTSHIEYRFRSNSSINIDSGNFNAVLKSVCSNFSSCWETEDLVQKLHNELRSRLEYLQEELAATEAINATLEMEITDLETEIQTVLSLKDEDTLNTYEEENQQVMPSNKETQDETEIVAKLTLDGKLVTSVKVNSVKNTDEVAMPSSSLYKLEHDYRGTNKEFHESSLISTQEELPSSSKKPDSLPQSSDIEYTKYLAQMASLKHRDDDDSETVTNVIEELDICNEETVISTEVNSFNNEVICKEMGTCPNETVDFAEEIVLGEGLIVSEEVVVCLTKDEKTVNDNEDNLSQKEEIITSSAEQPKQDMVSHSAETVTLKKDIRSPDIKIKPCEKTPARDVCHKREPVPPEIRRAPCKDVTHEYESMHPKYKTSSHKGATLPIKGKTVSSVETVSQKDKTLHAKEQFVPPRDTGVSTKEGAVPYKDETEFPAKKVATIMVETVPPKAITHAKEKISPKDETVSLKEKAAPIIENIPAKEKSILPKDTIVSPKEATPFTSENVPVKAKIPPKDKIVLPKEKKIPPVSDRGKKLYSKEGHVHCKEESLPPNTELLSSKGISALKKQTVPCIKEASSGVKAELNNDEIMLCDEETGPCSNEMMNCDDETAPSNVEAMHCDDEAVSCDEKMQCEESTELVRGYNATVSCDDEAMQCDEEKVHYSKETMHCNNQLVNCNEGTIFCNAGIEAVNCIKEAVDCNEMADCKEQPIQFDGQKSKLETPNT